MVRQTSGINPILSLIVATALWGVATVISKNLLASVPPITFLLIQLIPSVCALWLTAFAVRASLRLPLVPIALLGILNPGMSYTLSMLGLTTTTASVATLLWAAEPALIVVVAWLLREEELSARFLLATAAAAGGVVLVSGLIGARDLRADDLVGPALILGGVLCCALYTVLMRRMASRYDPLTATAVQQSAGLFWAAAIWPLESHGGYGTLVAMPSEVLAGAALSGLMYYAIAFWFYLSALRTVSAATAGIFLNLTPLFGIATASVVLGERLTPLQWTGGAIIIVSVIALLGSASTEMPNQRQPRRE